MRIRYKPLLVAMSLLLGAGLAFAQSSGSKSAGPTTNDVRLRVTINNELAGSQGLVVEAMSPSGDIVDRKEINFNGVLRGQSFFLVLSQPALSQSAARRGQSFPNRRNSNVVGKPASRAGDHTRSASPRKALQTEMLPRTRQSGLDLVVSRQ